MPIEVELKARLTDPTAVHAKLQQLAAGRTSTYHDTYYDYPDQRLERSGRQELRLRTVTSPTGTRNLLTFKKAMLDTTSTPEYETLVDQPDMINAILIGLGLTPTIAYTKHCENYRFTTTGHDILATVVQVPELDGTFLEVETVIDDDGDRDHAEQAINVVLETLGLGSGDLEPTYYIDMVRGARLDVDHD